MTSNLTDSSLARENKWKKKKLKNEEKKNEKKQKNLSAQSDVQQYRIVFIKSHLANGFHYCLFSVHILDRAMQWRHSDLRALTPAQLQGSHV